MWGKWLGFGPSVRPSQDPQTDETCRKVKNHQQMPTKYHFSDGWQIRPLIWNMPTNSEGVSEHATDLCEVYALVARKENSNFWLL